jgi:hypothetical protein
MRAGEIAPFADFFGVGLGRLSWLGEMVGVRDSFAATGMDPIAGFATYQELDVGLGRGLDLAATYEFADPDIDYAHGRLERAGAFLEWFPIPSVEIRVMARHAYGPRALLPGGATRDDLLVFAHLYF